MSTTFRVSDVAVQKPRLSGAVDLTGLFEKITQKPVEACAARATSLLPSRYHPLVEAFHLSFAQHIPLVLSPDDIWLTIAQGFAVHINNNADSLRSKFVQHEGQAVIRIDRDDFVKGGTHNDWPSCFGQFSDAISTYIGEDKRKLVTNDFSTTGVLERAASDVVLMDAMKAYFKYIVRTRCGIPEVTLLGTPEDWESIRTRAAAFASYGLDWWVQELLPTLDEFVRASKGHANADYWQSAYKVNSMSGGDAMTGWLNNLFPYLEGYPGVYSERNNMIGKTRGWGTTLSSLPTGLSCVPFVWEYLGRSFNMQLLAGFLGVEAYQGYAVRPSMVWGVQDADPRGT